MIRAPVGESGCITRRCQKIVRRRLVRFCGCNSISTWVQTVDAVLHERQGIKDRGLGQLLAASDAILKKIKQQCVKNAVTP